MKKFIKKKIVNSLISNATVNAALDQPSTSYISRRSKMNPVVHPHLPFDPSPHTQVEQGIQDVDYQIYPQYTNETQEKYDNSQIVYMLCDSPTDVPPVTYSKPPPPLPNDNEQPVESITIHCSESENEGSSPDVILIESTSPVKKKWETIDKVNSSSEIGDNKTTPKKCPHCQDQEFRLQFNMEKFQKMLLSRQKLDAEISLLDKKLVDLYQIILLFE